jgi:hypothetical protein
MEWKILIVCALFGILSNMSSARETKELIINRPASLAENQELILQTGDYIIFEPNNKRSEIRIFDSAVIVTDDESIMVEGIKNGNPAICVVPASEAKKHMVIGTKIYREETADAGKISYTSDLISEKPPYYLEMFKENLCKYIAECDGKVLTPPFPKLIATGVVIVRKSKNTANHNKQLFEELKKKAEDKIGSKAIGKFQDSKQEELDIDPYLLEKIINSSKSGELNKSSKNTKITPAKKNIKRP